MAVGAEKLTPVRTLRAGSWVASRCETSDPPDQADRLARSHATSVSGRFQERFQNTPGAVETDFETYLKPSRLMIRRCSTLMDCLPLQTWRSISTCPSPLCMRGGTVTRAPRDSGSAVMYASEGATSNAGSMTA